MNIGSCRSGNIIITSLSIVITVIVFDAELGCTEYENNKESH